ncbi:MAG: hypothetical protein P8M30_11565 [Planctomycetaceae bacterium]|mgnify:CR=1 FL=1|jgi:hypothetical protein|nr:hypothetical protein [bacterium]MDC0308486.1 hypothetical protein [Planctomycetaceae bacterium]MDG2389947.1 hypothetical protein [Planctomycetaceae bacterium]
MSQELMIEEKDVVLETEELVYEESEEDSETVMDEVELNQGVDFEALGIDPETPTQAKPGSEEKVLMLSARYAAGLPLWDNSDRYDHAPGQSALSGLKFEA